MAVNDIEIGKRIRKERKERGLTQEDFAELLNLSRESRPSISNWENGKTRPPFEHIHRMCEIFECELDYLLCKYDCKTRKDTDIAEATGLSRNAVNRLRTIKHLTICDLDVLDKLILHEDFIELLMAMQAYHFEINKMKREKRQQPISRKAGHIGYQTSDASTFMESPSSREIEMILIRILSGNTSRKTSRRLFNLDVDDHKSIAV